MDLSLSPAHEAFTREVAEFLQSRSTLGEVPTDSAGKVEYQRKWQRELADGRLVAVHWPEEHGGRGLGWTENFIVQEQLAISGAPEIINRIAVNLVGPTLIRHGTDAQRTKFLPGIVRADDIWCQLFSEPDAGSDLRSMRTEARRVEGGWRVRGQKVWASNAQYADYGILLARLADDRANIGFFLISMNQPEIRVRPLRQLSGNDDFNEVFLDDAFVADDQVVGDVTKGWSIAHTTLGYERATSPRQLIVHVGLMDELVAQAGRSAVEPLVRIKLARHYTELRIYRLHLLRVLSELEAGRVPSANSSMVKLFWSEMAQRMHETSMLMLGGDGIAHSSARQGSYLYYRACTIFAGTSEIQRNTLAERVLGLPREPKVVSE